MSTPKVLPPTAPARSSTRVVKRRRSFGPWVVFAVVAVLVAGAVIVGYQQRWFSPNSSSEGCSSGVTLQGDGAQFVAPLMAAWTAAYHAQTANMVNFPASGSGTGVTHFSENPPLIDFAVTDDPLTPEERAAMPAQPLTLPIVGGALAIIYNLPGVSGHLHLTGAVLASIYEGDITRWNDTRIATLNPDLPLPNATIATVHRSDPAGTTYVLTDFLAQDSASWASSVGTGISVSWPSAPTQTAVKGNSLVLGTVASTSDSIGYSDLTDVLTYSKAVSYAAIQNPAHSFIVPDIANTESAIVDKVASTPAFPNSTGDWYDLSLVNANGTGDYPLVTFVYLFVYQQLNAGFEPSESKAQVVVQWLEWALSTGQTLTNEATPNPLFYAGLPAVILSIDTAGISSMTYHGAAIPNC